MYQRKCIIDINTYKTRKYIHTWQRRYHLLVAIQREDSFRDARIVDTGITISRCNIDRIIHLTTKLRHFTRHSLLTHNSVPRKTRNNREKYATTTRRVRDPTFSSAILRIFEVSSRLKRRTNHSVALTFKFLGCVQKLSDIK